MTDDKKSGPGRAGHNCSERDEEYSEIAVNGTLMRGLELEPNLINLGAKFVCEDYTASAYRLFSIDDVHPGMVRIPVSRVEKFDPVSVAVEIWSLPSSGIVKLLEKEPPGLSIGKIRLLNSNTKVLGVLAETALVIGKKDISDFPGAGKANFRDYIVQEGARLIDEALRQETDVTGDVLVRVQEFRAAALLRHKEGRLTEAIDLLNYCVKNIGIESRLFQNIPARSEKSLHLVGSLTSKRKESTDD